MHLRMGRESWVGEKTGALAIIQESDWKIFKPLNPFYEEKKQLYVLFLKKTLILFFKKKNSKKECLVTLGVGVFRI